MAIRRSCVRLTSQRLSRPLESRVTRRSFNSNPPSSRPTVETSADVKEKTPRPPPTRNPSTIPTTSSDPNRVPQTNLSSGTITTPPHAITIANRKDARIKRQNVSLTPLDKARLLLRWSWFDVDSPQRLELEQVFAEDASPDSTENLPTWLEETFDVARSFRSARARLWLPKEAKEAEGGTHEWIQSRVDDRVAQLEQVVEQKKRSIQVGSVSKDPSQLSQAQAELAAAEEQVEDWMLTNEEEQIDFVLRKEWESLSKEQREQGTLRARFECARRLGWRKGYTAGYPTTDVERRSKMNELVADISKNTSHTSKAQQKASDRLASEDEKDAWEDWQRLDKATRTAEERHAWSLRDRSRIYIDDSSSSIILGAPAPRWYAKPERVGLLTYLPNDVIRLVRNDTARGQKYDVWKATLRTPLNMHKHALRSYLLSIYGLRTTWARSSIYRSPISRTPGLRQKTARGSRTYKKVEVGLLEPFVFPEVTQRFKREQLMEEEMKFEMANVFFRATGKRRWRSKRRPDPMREENDGAAIEENRVTTRFDGSSTTTIPARGDLKSRSAMLTRAGGIPTQRQSRILKILNDRRKAHEQAIGARMDQLKEQAAQR